MGRREQGRNGEGKKKWMGEERERENRKNLCQEVGKSLARSGEESWECCLEGG